MNWFRKFFGGQSETSTSAPSGQSDATWNPPTSSNSEDYVRRCLEQEFQEVTENRTFRDDPGFAEVLEPLNACNFTKAIEMARRIIPSHPDFDLPYKWLGSALRETGSLVESRKVYSEGLRRSKRKLVILTDMGETEFESGNIDAAVYAWSQAMHCLSKNPIDYNAYLLLSYVAQGLQLDDVAAAFLAQVDKLQAGRVRLEPQKADRLITLARRSDSAPIKEVLTQLRKKYL